nr:MAG TPA: hypothetical protein [Caudoviricetes sp.]
MPPHLRLFLLFFIYIHCLRGKFPSFCIYKLQIAIFLSLHFFSVNYYLVSGSASMITKGCSICIPCNDSYFFYFFFGNRQFIFS